MAQIKTNYDAYKAGLPEDSVPRSWWSFAISEARRLYDAEPEEVKQQVLTYCSAHIANPHSPVVDLVELLRTGEDTAIEHARALQEYVDTHLVPEQH